MIRLRIILLLALWCGCMVREVRADEWPAYPDGIREDYCETVAMDRYLDRVDEGEDEADANRAAAVAFDYCITRG